MKNFKNKINIEIENKIKESNFKKDIEDKFKNQFYTITDIDEINNNRNDILNELIQQEKRGKVKLEEKNKSEIDNLKNESKKNYDELDLKFLKKLETIKKNFDNKKNILNELKKEKVNELEKHIEILSNKNKKMKLEIEENKNNEKIKLIIEKEDKIDKLNKEMIKILNSNDINFENKIEKLRNNYYIEQNKLLDEERKELTNIESKLSIGKKQLQVLLMNKLEEEKNKFNNDLKNI